MNINENYDTFIEADQCETDIFKTGQNTNNSLMLKDCAETSWF